MKKLTLFYKKEDPDIAKIARQLVGEVKKALGLQMSIETVFRGGAVISLGGDGTLLRAAKIAAAKNCPVLGIHLGGIGFLNEVELKDRLPAIQRLLCEDYLLDQRLMVEGRVFRNGQPVGKVLALNDIVIGKCDIARTVSLEVHHHGKKINNYRLDGLIISTPTGSTGHNLSAGGPLLYPNTQNVAITPICPIKTGHYPVVLDAEAIEVIITKTPGKRQAILTADGQEKIYLKDGDRIIIEKSNLTAKLARLKPYDFFAVLRHKLW